MNTPTREDLLGFILGALDAPEHQQVADSLVQRPDLQLEIERIKQRLAPLQVCKQPPAALPVGLARRACEFISRESRLAVQPAPNPSPNNCPPAANEPPADTAKVSSSAKKRRRILESAALVCCAAVLGTALGPTAMHFAQALRSGPVPSGAIAGARNLIPANSPIERSDELLRRMESTAALADMESAVATRSPVSLPTFISMTDEPIEPLFAGNPGPWANRGEVGSSPWRSRILERSVDTLECSVSSSLGQIGSRPLFDRYSDASSDVNIQFVSN